MVRVVHAGDFHLDSAFGALTPEQARQRRMESRRTPERLVEWANDHGADLLLLSGDLFDSDSLYGDTAPLLAQALGCFRGQAVIAPATTIPLHRTGPMPARAGATTFTSLQRAVCRPLHFRT